MKLAIKRYALPPLLAICLYTLLYFIFGINTGYFNAGVVICILYSFSMRFTDDISDYEKDKENNKALLSKNTLYVLLIISTVGIILLALFFSLYLTLIPLIILSILFIFPKIGEYFKPLFVPSIMIVICFSLFSVNYVLWILVGLLTIADAFLVFKRRR